MISQRDRVKGMLEAAGPKGLRSDIFLEARIPRAAARVGELKDLGFKIDSVREKQFCRWTWRGNVGVGTGELKASQPKGQGGPENRSLSPDSGVETSNHLPPTGSRPTTSPYEVWVS